MLPAVSLSRVPQSVEHKPQYVARLHNEILPGIFQLAVSQYQDILTLSQVCRQWRNMMAYAVGDNCFWKNIFCGAGLPFPSSTERAHLAFAYATSQLLLNRVRARLIPHVQELKAAVNFADYRETAFLEDTHAVLYNEFEICICNLNNVDEVQKITTSSKIRSVCAAQGMIYYSLDTKAIFAYSLKDGAHAPFYDQGPQIVEQSPNNFGSAFSRLLANDKWLICISGQFIKLLNRGTGELVRTRNMGRGMQYFQIDCDKLYWCELDIGQKGSTLHWWDLNTGLSFKYTLKPGKHAICSLHVQRNRCSYLQKISTKDDEYNQFAELSDKSLQASFDDILNMDNIVPMNPFAGVGQSLIKDDRGCASNDVDMSHSANDVFASENMSLMELLNPYSKSSIVESYDKYLEKSFASDVDLYDCDDGVLDKDAIITVNLITGERKSHFIKTRGLNESPHLCTVNSLAIFTRDSFDPEQIYDDDMALTGPNIVEFIDLRNGKTVHSVQKHSIHGSMCRWSLTAFQEKILYLTEDNRIVKITFPQPACDQSSNRNGFSENVDEQDNKRRKLS